MGEFFNNLGKGILNLEIALMFLISSSFIGSVLFKDCEPPKIYNDRFSEYNINDFRGYESRFSFPNVRKRNIKGVIYTTYSNPDGSCKVFQVDRGKNTNIYFFRGKEKVLAVKNFPPKGLDSNDWYDPYLRDGYPFWERSSK
ncbi:MAG: hypothetical protein P8X70_00185 [Nanoarchaeota archaeon]